MPRLGHDRDTDQVEDAQHDGDRVPNRGLEGHGEIPYGDHRLLASNAVIRHLAERAAVSRIAPKVRRAAAPRYRSFRKHRTRPTSMNPSARWAAALTSLSGCASDANSLQPCERPHPSAATISAWPTPLRRAFGTTNHPSRYATRLLPQPSAYARIDSSASPTGHPAPSSASRTASGSRRWPAKNRSISSRCSTSRRSGQRACRSWSQAAASVVFAVRTVIIQVLPPNGLRLSCGA